jgi:hypothetical protein
VITLSMKNCPICMRGLSNREICVLACRHIFHSKCVQPWLRVHKACPVCRSVNTVCQHEDHVLPKTTTKGPMVLLSTVGTTTPFVHVHFTVFMSVTFHRWAQQMHCGHIVNYWRTLVKWSHSSVTLFHRSYHRYSLLIWMWKKIMKNKNKFYSLNMNSNEDDCSICMSRLVGDKLCTLACRHIFHSHCVQPWLQEHQTCPMCRSRNIVCQHEEHLLKSVDTTFRLYKAPMVLLSTVTDPFLCPSELQSLYHQRR